MIYLGKILPLFFCFVFIKNGLACKCDKMISVTDGLNYSDLVFAGKVISVEHSTNFKSLIVCKGDTNNSLHRINYYPLQIVKIKLTRLYKGSVAVDTVTVLTGNNRASCGCKFLEGQNYIVYGSFRSYFSIQHILSTLQILLFAGRIAAPGQPFFLLRKRNRFSG